MRKYPELRPDEVWVSTTTKHKNGNMTTYTSGNADIADVAEALYHHSITLGYDETKRHIVKLKEQFALKQTLLELADLLKQLARS